MYRHRWWLAGVLLSMACLTQAEPLPSELLLGRPAFGNPSLSPDGSRLAIVADTGHGQNALVVMQVNGVDLKPMLKTSVPGLIDVTAYHWISNDVLLLWIDVGGGDGSVWAMLDIAKGVMVQMEHPYAHLLQDHWGDAEHVLTFDLCSVDEYCFYVWNIRTNNGIAYAKPISNSSGAEPRVLNKTQLISVTRASDGTLQRQGWDPGAHAWGALPSLPAGSPEPSEDTGNTALANARTRYDALAKVNGSVSAVRTSGGHDIIGASVPAPGPAFLSLVPALDSPVGQIAAAYPDKRVYWLELSDDLKRGLISVQGIGEPRVFYLWSAEPPRFAPFASSQPQLELSRLGKAQLEEGWVDDGAPVAVTLPPSGVSANALLVSAFISASPQARNTLIDFNQQAQVLAQHGVVVLSVPVAPVEPRGALTGAAWRRAVAQRLAAAADHAIQAGLVGPGHTCVEGTYMGGYAALAAAAAQPETFPCVIAINVPFRPSELAHPILIQGMAGHTNFSWNLTGSEPLWLAMTATDGTDSGDPISWAGKLPGRTFLAYTMTIDTFGAGIKSQSDDFVAALKRSGKAVQVYASSREFDDTPKWLAGMDDAMLSFMH